MNLHTKSRNNFDKLQFEKCEERNLLSVSSAVDLGSFAELGNEQFVLNQLSEAEQTAWLQKGVFDLQLVGVSDTETGLQSQFQQTMDGLPVNGSFLTVTQGPKGNILDVADRVFSRLATQDSLTPGLDASQAEQIANSEFDSRVDFSSNAELVWFNNGNRLELAWKVSTVAIGVEANNADIELNSVIDANTGEMLSQSQKALASDELVTTNSDDIYARITINDTIGAAGSRAYAAPFDSVVELNLGCTGTLIAPNVVLSARHCGAGDGNTIDFGDNGSSPVFTAVVQSSSLPDGAGSLLDGGDVAILTLTADVPGNIATPMRLIDATDDLVGRTASLNGYGLNGLGSTGHGFTSDGWRWGGENIIDRYGQPASASGANIISTDFDNEAGTTNTISGSDPTALEFEATTAGGDSGGAVFVQEGGEWLIGGVLSGGTTGESVYGDISWWTGTAIYRAEIEAAGGVFADGGLGTVGFDATTYLFGDTISLAVNDSNHTGPLNVTVTSDSGDTETISLTGSGPGFTGSIQVTDAAVATNDGILQANDADTITVTYIDADDGTGNSNTVSDTAIVFEPADGSLVGIDFDESGANSPSNWDLIDGGSNAFFENLPNENDEITAIDLVITEIGDGSWDDFAATPNAGTIPQYSNSLTNIDGQIYTGADPIQLIYQDLTPGTDYEIYVMAVDSFFDSIQQTVTITGATTASFLQDFDSGELIVNGQVGSSANQLETYAEVAEADVNGEITIDITPIAGTSDVVLAGVAIQEVPNDIPLLDPFGSKYLDGVITSGGLAEARLSDDVYLQLEPSATTNPFKQKIETILSGEYTGGAANTLGFRMEAIMNGGPAGDVIQTIRFRNQNQVWEVIDERAIDATESVVEVFAGGDVNRFLHPLTGETLVRIEWKSESFSGTPFTWTVDVDQWGWIIT